MLAWLILEALRGYKIIYRGPLGVSLARLVSFWRLLEGTVCGNPLLDSVSLEVPKR